MTQTSCKAVADALARLPPNAALEAIEQCGELVKRRQLDDPRSGLTVLTPTSPPGEHRPQAEDRDRQRQHPLPGESADPERVPERLRQV